MFDMMALTAQLLNLEITEKTLVREPAHHWPTPRTLQRQTRLDAERVLELVTRYLHGDSAAELAATFDVSEATVWAHLKRHGSPERPYRKLHGQLLEEAKKLYLAGASQLAIAHELGISRTAVRSGLLAGGITLRDRRGSR